MYRCKNCYHGVDLEELNSAFQCPICGVEKECFEEIKEDEEFKGIPIAFDNIAIRRINDKCINCGRCAFVCENMVGVKYDKKQKHPICLNCGACIQNCPMGAIVPNYAYKKVLEAIEDPNKIVIVSTSPAVRFALGDIFNEPYGNDVEGKMVSALKELGFNYVLDTTFGADLTTMEEATEFLDRIENKKRLPQFTSCCPSWVKYLEIYHPELKDNLSSCKSPIGMQGSIVKTYFAKQNDLNPEDVIHVALTPCTAKKYEISKDELNDSDDYNEMENMKDTDYVITTSELGLMLQEKGIDFSNLLPKTFDSIMNKGSSGGLLFGHHTGVTTSLIRTLHYLITKEDLDDDLKFENQDEHIKTLEIKIGDYNLRVAIIEGLLKAEKILDNLDKYDLIEVMNCIGGCIGGGGQPLNPINEKEEVLKAREKGIINSSDNDIIRASYQNPDIKRIYKEFLEQPNSKISKTLLHTFYQDRSYLLEKEK